MKCGRCYLGWFGAIESECIRGPSQNFFRSPGITAFSGKGESSDVKER